MLNYGYQFSSASSPTRSLTFGRWGCGERDHLSHVVRNAVAVLFENAFCGPSRAPERDFQVLVMF